MWFQFQLHDFAGSLLEHMYFERVSDKKAQMFFLEEQRIVAYLGRKSKKKKEL